MSEIQTPSRAPVSDFLGTRLLCLVPAPDVKPPGRVQVKEQLSTLLNTGSRKRRRKNALEGPGRTGRDVGNQQALPE